MWVCVGVVMYIVCMWVCAGVVMYTMYRTARLGYSIVIQEGGGGGGGGG